VAEDFSDRNFNRLPRFGLDEECLELLIDLLGGFRVKECSQVRADVSGGSQDRFRLGHGSDEVG
jgi:hypothetical protein